jgi:hypothetical protein
MPQESHERRLDSQDLSKHQGMRSGGSLILQSLSSPLRSTRPVVVLADNFDKLRIHSVVMEVSIDDIDDSSSSSDEYFDESDSEWEVQTEETGVDEDRKSTRLSDVKDDSSILHAADRLGARTPTGRGRSSTGSRHRHQKSTSTSRSHQTSTALPGRRLRRSNARIRVHGHDHRQSSTRCKKGNYTEAVGEARLAWQWVEGWRARLRKGGDMIEEARWEWRLEDRLPRLPFEAEKTGKMPSAVTVVEVEGV